MPETVKVLVFEPGKPPAVREIAQDYRAMQAVVGGLIEHVHMGLGGPEVGLYMNEEGRLLGMPWNRTTDLFPIAGTFLVVDHDDEGHTRSLTDEQIEEVKAYFAGREIEGPSFEPAVMVSMDPREFERGRLKDMAKLIVQQALLRVELPEGTRELAWRYTEAFLVEQGRQPTRFELASLVNRAIRENGGRANDV